MKFELVKMVILIVSVILFFCIVAGCSTKGVDATIFLKEDDSRWYNSQGKDCLESGYKIIKNDRGDTYRIVTYFSNCEVEHERTLKEFELKQWILPKGKQ